MNDIFFENPVLLDLPTTIKTPRLIIRPPKVGEGKDISVAVQETWDDLSIWEDWAIDYNEASSERFWELRTRKALAQFILRETLEFRSYCAHSGDFIGITDLCYPNWDVRSFVAGYWIRKSEQNKGYATEATNALIRYAFAVLNARHIGIGHAVGNVASEKVVNKLGFQKIGRRPQILQLPGGRIVDDLIYYRCNTDNLPALDVSWE